MTGCRAARQGGRHLGQGAACRQPKRLRNNSGASMASGEPEQAHVIGFREVDQAEFPPMSRAARNHRSAMRGLKVKAARGQGGGDATGNLPRNW